MQAHAPAFAPWRNSVIGPLSWGLASCKPGMCPWCLLGCAHGNLEHAERRAIEQLEELERERAAHWAGHLVLLLLDWCRADCTNLPATVLGPDVAWRGLAALGIYAGLDVTQSLAVQLSGPARAASSAAVQQQARAKAAPGNNMPPPAPRDQGEDTPQGTRKRSESPLLVPDAPPVALAPPRQASQEPPAPQLVGETRHSDEDIWEYYGGSRTGWVPYDLATQRLLRQCHAGGGGTTLVKIGTRTWWIDNRPSKMEMSNPVEGQGPRKIRIRPPAPAD